MWWDEDEDVSPLFTYDAHYDQPMSQDRWPIKPTKRWDAPHTFNDAIKLMDKYKQKKSEYADFNDFLALTALSANAIFDPFAKEDIPVSKEYDWLRDVADYIGEDEDIAEFAMRFMRLMNKTGKKKMKEMMGEGNSEVIKKMLEKQKASEQKKPGGKKGGTEESGRVGSGAYYRYLAQAMKTPMFDLAKSDIVKRAKSSKPSKTEYGRPQIKTVRKFLRKTYEMDYLTPEMLCLDDDQFDLHMYEGKLEVDLPHRIVKTKQQLIVLVDESGSMGWGDKQVALVHILDSFFKEVEKGNSEIFFSYFVRKRETFKKISTKEEIEKFKQTGFREPSGGNTEVGHILTTLAADLASGKIDGFEMSERTEVVVINDGEDTIGTIECDVPIHAFTLEEMNNDLLNATKRTKGQYFHVKGGSFQLL